jgi:hypothetical protein
MSEQRVAGGGGIGPIERVHLIYPHSERISNPDAIGRETGRRLEARYEVLYYDWFELGVIKPGPNDALVGHPHPHPDSIFRRSLKEPGWRRRIMLAPYHHDDLRQNAFTEWIIGDCDLFLATTGPHWFRTLPESHCSHWAPKMVRLDQGINRTHFPPIKTSFSPAGKRRAVYIGHTGLGKGTAYLAQIAALLPDIEIGWMGSGKRPIPGVTALGQIDFGTQAGRELVSGFDFLLTVGNSDANPTTILESMSWGLLPICTPTCGYEGIPSIVNVPYGDAPAAAAIVRRTLAADDAELRATQATNWRLLDTYYNWDRFAGQVIEAIESDVSPALLPESLGRRLLFYWYDITSPYGRVVWSRPWMALARARRTVGRWRRQAVARLRHPLARS